MDSTATDRTPRYADMFAAMGSEQRLRIVRILLSAHPDGMVVQDIQSELGVAASTLSHHLDKLKNEGLVTVVRERTYLRYRVNTATLRELLEFLYADCCSRTSAGQPDTVLEIKGAKK